MTVRSGELRSTSGPALRRRGWLAGLVPVVVALSVAACTTTGPTGAGPSTSTGASVPSASPTTPPSPTATATVTDDDLAIAAVRAYYDALNTAMRTRATGDFRRTFTGACSVCKEDAKHIDDALAAGHTFEGAGFAVSDLKVTAHQDATHIMVRGTVALPPLTTRDGAGQIIQQSSGSSGAKDFSVVVGDGRWRVDLVSR